MSDNEHTIRDLFIEFLQDINFKKNEVLMKDTIIYWFRINYPEIELGLLENHLDLITTNSSNRTNYAVRFNGEDDILFQAYDSVYRLYDRDSDPPPVIKPKTEILTQDKDKIMKLLFNEYLQGIHLEKNQIIMKDLIIGWFNRKYPEIKLESIEKHLTWISTNDKNRIVYGVNPNGDDDKLFKCYDSVYRLYDKDTDPSPIHSFKPSSYLTNTEHEIEEGKKFFHFFNTLDFGNLKNWQLNTPKKKIIVSVIVFTVLIVALLNLRWCLYETDSDILKYPFNFRVPLIESGIVTGLGGS